ncbi:hypothetical protein K1719_018524 [Acacia pycnantha]|nr:hypothetical protein K1719_018524 [Acacia pycnantha]
MRSKSTSIFALKFQTWDGIHSPLISLYALLYILLGIHWMLLALLTVSDDEFWEGVSPVEFGDLPALQDAVTVVGYPIGGVQVDAAINEGNSGGPAFSDEGKCVGIAFQALNDEDAENIGYVIPTPIILHFIRGIMHMNIEQQPLKDNKMPVLLSLNAIKMLKP